MDPVRPAVYVTCGADYLGQVEQLEKGILEEWEALDALRSEEELTRDIESLTLQNQGAAPLDNEVEASDEVRAREERVYGLVNRYPAAENGSKFIGSHCIVCPQLVVKKRNMQPIHEEQCEGNLFLTEVGKALQNRDGKSLQIDPLFHELFGSITEEPRSLVLRNIRLAPGSTLKPNEWTKERIHQESMSTDTVLIHKQADFGPYNIDPRLNSCELLADIQFGAFERRDHAIKAQITGYEDSIQWVIPLFPLAGKIQFDGSVTLKNGATFTMEQLDVPCPEVWLKQTHRHELDVNVAADGGCGF